MEAVKPRKSTAFRLDNDLLERLKAEAKRENRSLNNHVETIILDAVYYKTIPETLEAIEEVRSGKELEKLDLEHFDEYVKSL